MQSGIIQDPVSITMIVFSSRDFGLATLFLEGKKGRREVRGEDLAKVLQQLFHLFPNLLLEWHESQVLKNPPFFRAQW